MGTQNGDDEHQKWDCEQFRWNPVTMEAQPAGQCQEHQPQQHGEKEGKPAEAAEDPAQRPAGHGIDPQSFASASVPSSAGPGAVIVHAAPAEVCQVRTFPCLNLPRRNGLKETCYSRA